MHDFSCCDPDEMNDGPFADRARYLKRDPEGVGRICKILEDMQAEAMEMGIEKDTLKTLAGLVRDGVLPLSQAAERSGMTPEQFAERAAKDGLAIG